eukprot:268331-Rhodomonas_salina.2
MLKGRLAPASGTSLLRNRTRISTIFRVESVSGTFCSETRSQTLVLFLRSGSAAGDLRPVFRRARTRSAASESRAPADSPASASRVHQRKRHERQSQRTAATKGSTAAECVIIAPKNSSAAPINRGPPDPPPSTQRGAPSRSILRRWPKHPRAQNQITEKRKCTLRNHIDRVAFPVQSIPERKAFAIDSGRLRGGRKPDVDHSHRARVAVYLVPASSCRSVPDMGRDGEIKSETAQSWYSWVLAQAEIKCKKLTFQ